eukprot:111594-Alexandrium_andersonii.AAC.1
MSASLVGSEMCIRDRPRKRPQKRYPKLVRGALCVLFLRRCPLFSGSATCLLYTSDAADDM